VGVVAAAVVTAALAVRGLTAPLAVNANFGNGDREVPRTALIQLRFTHDMDVASVQQATSIEPATPVTVSATGKRRFTITAALKPDTAYRLLLDDARSASGSNRITYRLHFHTEPAPQVSGVMLDALVLADGQQGVPPSGRLKLAFSQPMDAGRTPLLLDGTPLSGKVQWAQDGKSLAADVALGRSRPHVLSIPQSAVNRRQDPFLSDWTLSFTTVIDVPTAGIPDRIGSGAPAIIQIENSLDARPQLGVQQADIIYEYISEGSVPRLTAVYWHPLPDRVGPVRSCRLITLQIQQMFKGMIYCSGANDYILGQVFKVPNLVNDYSRPQDGVYFRTNDRYAPHDVIMRGGNASALMAKQNMPAPTYALTPKHDDAVRTGDPAPQIVVSDHNTLWTYDPAARQYLKRQDGAPLINAGTGQVRAKSVIVQQVTSYLDTHPGNKFQGYFTEYYELKGEGRADVFTGGVVIHATWRRPDLNAPVAYYTTDGEPIELDTGLTWVHVIGSEKWHL